MAGAIHGRDFNMENQVNSFVALYKAYQKTRCGKRDNPTAMRYRMEAIERTADLSDRLQRRDYTFGPYYPLQGVRAQGAPRPRH